MYTFGNKYKIVQGFCTLTAHKIQITTKCARAVSKFQRHDTNATRQLRERLVNIFAQSVAETGLTAFSTTTIELRQPSLHSCVLKLTNSLKPLAYRRGLQ